MTGRPGELGIGDRVRSGGRDQVVIGVSGPVVRLAGTGGEVVTVGVSGLLADGGFAVLDSRPRPGMPQVSVLDGLPAEAAEEARWWERHIAEVLTGVPPDAGEGTIPRPEYDPAVVTLTRREQAKAAELTAAGHPVTASAVAKRRRRCQEQGLSGMVDYRARRRMPPHGRADAVVVAAMRQAIGEAAGDSTRTASLVFRRAREILAGAGGGERGKLPSERTLYRLFGRLEAGCHTTGSASTRRSLAARPGGPFGQVPAAAPGDVMQIGSTPLDVLVRLDSGVPGRVDLTGIIDVATRTVTAAVLRPATRPVDASVLLARTVTPEPMRPGWPQAMPMAASALPFRRMLSIDERLEHAAARPVIIPQVIVVDHGKGVRLGVVQGVLRVPGHQLPARPQSHRDRQAAHRADAGVGGDDVRPVRVRLYRAEPGIPRPRGREERRAVAARTAGPARPVAHRGIYRLEIKNHSSDLLLCIAYMSAT